jgi:hypothetical protein
MDRSGDEKLEEKLEEREGNDGAYVDVQDGLNSSERPLQPHCM